MLYFKSLNKKGISEVISFVLLTLVVVVASTSAYFFSTNLIDNSLSKNDLGNSKIYLEKMTYKIDSIMNFQDSSTSMNLEFNSGRFYFQGNQIYYQSTLEYLGNNFCFAKICVENIGGFERKYFNLSNSYVLKNNFSLVPGLYKLTFSNIKNESKLLVRIN